MVVGIIIDISCNVLLLQTADPVFQSGRTRNGPGTCKSFRVAGIGLERGGVCGKVDGDRGKIIDPRDPPRFRAVAQIAVGHADHRGHELDGDPCRFIRRREALRRRRCGDDTQWCLAVAADDRLQEVGLLGFCRKACTGPAPLYVDHHEGEFQHDRKSERLGLESKARAAGCCHRQRARIRCADGGTNRCDLVLGLECLDAEFP